MFLRHSIKRKRYAVITINKQWPKSKAFLWLLILHLERVNCWCQLLIIALLLLLLKAIAWSICCRLETVASTPVELIIHVREIIHWVASFSYRPRPIYTTSPDSEWLLFKTRAVGGANAILSVCSPVRPSHFSAVHCAKNALKVTSHFYLRLAVD